MPKGKKPAMDDAAPKPVDPVRAGFGMRLQVARKGKGLTQQQVADRLGIDGGKGTVSAWETGRGAPDAFTLRTLAKLYDVSADALLWEDSLSPTAMKIASEYDHLPAPKQADWRVLWLGFMSGAAPGGENLPMAPAPQAQPSASQAQAHAMLRGHQIPDPPPNRLGESQPIKPERNRSK